MKVKQFLIMLAALMVFLGGCNPVTMTPQYARSLEESQVNVSELNRRCQDGDDVACKQGLQKASETLELLVVGLHGEVE